MMFSQLRRRWPHQWSHEIALAVLLLCLIWLAQSLVPNFLSWRSQLIASRKLWDFALIAVLMTPVILTGGIDLSVGSMMSLSAVAFGLVFQSTSNLALASGTAIATATMAGLLNGVQTRVLPAPVNWLPFAS